MSRIREQLEFTPFNSLGVGKVPPGWLPQCTCLQSQVWKCGPEISVLVRCRWPIDPPSLPFPRRYPDPPPVSVRETLKGGVSACPIRKVPCPSIDTNKSPKFISFIRSPIFYCGFFLILTWWWLYKSTDTGGVGREVSVQGLLQGVFRHLSH